MLEWADWPCRLSCNGQTIRWHICIRECVKAGAAGARTRRNLGHHLLHPLILRLLVLSTPADFEVQSSLL